MRSMTVRDLTACYVVALSMVALLFVASHILMAETLRSNEGSAAIINLSGRQRMLSQRIVATALELDRGDESARAPLLRAIGDFDGAHRRLAALSQSDATNELTRTRLDDAYFGGAQIDAGVRRFLEAARHAATSAKPRTADLATLTGEARGPLLSGLEQIVTIHQQANETRIRRLEQLQWWILGTGLAVLLIEALFIFRPMVRRIGAHVRQLLQLADHDYLTGVVNRRAFTARGAQEIERARRHGQSLALLMIDADHFKRINDLHGHLVGDAVLVGIAKALSRAARREDIVARIGGEEFVLLLSDTTAFQASVAAERVRKVIAETAIDAAGVSVSVTVSIGIAALALDQDDPLRIALGVADKMLYRAKDAGRNCIWPHLTPADATVA